MMYLVIILIGLIILSIADYKSSYKKERVEKQKEEHRKRIEEITNEKTKL